MLENLIGRHVLIFVLKVQCLITLFTRTKYFFKAFWSKTSWVQRGNERLFSRWMVGKYFWCVIFGGQLVQAIKHLSNVFISFSVKLVFLISRATSSCTLTSFSCTDRILKMSISLYPEIQGDQKWMKKLEFILFIEHWLNAKYVQIRVTYSLS